ncbi:MAG: AAA family ATPase [Candidatus Binatia bacterium]
MYNAHFRFREVPFGLTSDPQFYYSNPVYQEAWGTLCYGMEARKGFIVLTGEAGTGKTTLLKKAMSTFGSKVKTAYVSSTPFNHAELLPSILTELGLPACDSRLTLLGDFSDYLTEQFRIGNIVALLIDEAQNLSLESLEELRCLGNFETAKNKLVQIVLAGQVALEQKLDEPTLRSLKQRVVLRCRLKPIAQSEIKLYMNSRLQVIGTSTENLFDPAAIEKIALYSTGIPRLINIICDNALLITDALSERKVSATVIDEVAEELRLGSSSEEKGERRLQALEEQGTGKSTPELLNDIKHRLPRIYHEDNALIKDFDDFSLIRKDAATLPATLDHQESSKHRKAFIARQLFRPRIGVFAAILLLIGLGSFFHPGEWRFSFHAFQNDAGVARGGGHKDIRNMALGPSALEPKSSAIIPEAKLSAPQSKTVSTPHQDASPLTKENPINVLLAAVKPNKDLDGLRPEKRREALRENKQESTSSANLAVTGNSFVRSSPTSNAKIITTLLPGTRIQVIGRMGEYYAIHSLDKKGIRGYVHKEDAFFGSTR